MELRIAFPENSDRLRQAADQFQADFESIK